MGESPAVRSEETQMSQVDAETTARVIADKRLGDRIRRLRLKKSMGLVELGKLTGLSASFLSQLETGRVVPTLRNLARIAMVFSKDLSYFFESDASAMFRIHRRKERVRLPQTGVESPTYYFESLGYMVPDRPMDPYFAEFIPLTGAVEPRRICIRASSFFICWRERSNFATASSNASWRRATRSTLTPARRTPINAPARNQPKRSS